MRSAWGFSAGSVALALAIACGQPAARADAPSGRELRVGEQQEPATLNPVIGTLLVETDAYNLVFDGLFRHDVKGDLVPDLATRVPTLANGGVSRDGRTITYRLVRNARWHDGVPVTSDDVKFTFEAIMDGRNNVASRFGYEEIARVDTPDRYTVVLHLKRLWAPIVQTVFADGIQGAIVPAHLLRGVSDFNRAAFNTAPVGSGPYRFVSWNHGSSMTFAANPTYFRGAPKIPRIVWNFIPDDNVLATNIRTGEVDMVNNLEPAPYAQVGSVAGMSPALGRSLGWEHLTFNTAREPLSDVRVRRALCMGFDVGDVFTKIVHGIGQVGAGLQNPSSPWYAHGLQSCRFDFQAASKLLDAAGWRSGPGGMRSRAGKPLQIEFATVAGIVDRAQTQVLLQQDWKGLGIDTQVRTYLPALFFAPAQSGGIMLGGKFDVALSAYYLPSLDPSREQFLSADDIPPRGNNAAFWHNARVTALERSGAGTNDATVRKRCYDEIQRIVAREVPYVTMRWRGTVAMHKTELRGVAPAIVGSTFWNVNQWTFPARTALLGPPRVFMR
jgi:peptide/nickel transport system substrate-binding protein